MRTNSQRNHEQGVIITLVAVFMLFVMVAMAALAIDVVTLYTARSEAQLAADGAALAGARVLANSGMTSDPNASSDGLMDTAETLARAIATQVAKSNQVGGRNLNAIGACGPGSEISVCFNDSANNPQVTVQVTRTDLPTFFARLWGSKTLSVAASATAEAYNPSGLATGAAASSGSLIAPTCVKPWLLPNIDPSGNGNQIFTPATGAIADPTLLGTSPQGLKVDCNPADCSGGLLPPSPWNYYPGDTSSKGIFNAGSTSITCSPSVTGFTPTDYQLSIAGCEPTPIACN